MLETPFVIKSSYLYYIRKGGCLIKKTKKRTPPGLLSLSPASQIPDFQRKSGMCSYSFSYLHSNSLKKDLEEMRKRTAPLSPPLLNLISTCPFSGYAHFVVPARPFSCPFEKGFERHEQMPCGLLLVLPCAREEIGCPGKRCARGRGKGFTDLSRPISYSRHKQKKPMHTHYVHA